MHVCTTPMYPRPHTYNTHTNVFLFLFLKKGLDGRRQSSRDYAKAVHDRWGVGDSRAGTGVLLFLSKSDRMVYISTGDLNPETLNEHP
jgi:hypothetical protein